MTEQQHNLPSASLTRHISTLRGWDKNPRSITKDGFERLKKQIQKLGQYKPLLITPDGEVLGGNMRLKAYQELGVDDVWVSVVNPKDEAEKLAYALSDNDRAGFYDDDLLANLIPDYPDFEWENYAVDLKEPTNLQDLLDQFKEVEEDEIPEVSNEPAISEYGKVYQLGRHRIMCGDSTKIEDVMKLMDGKKADMVFTDPPYGIKKEIENDNLNIEDLILFNNKWIANTVGFVKDCGYIYIWGYFQVLAETWTTVIKPLEKVGFRNFIIWKKRGKVQGINNEDFRMFPPAYEACLVFVWGQQFGNGAWSSTPNAEYYWEGYEPIRAYLDCERKKMGWDIPTVKTIVGHSDLWRDHWFSKSQWSMITEKVYTILQEKAEGKAFRKQYDDLRKQYDDLRGYFDNSNGFTDVWEFEKESGDENHPTVKPIELCQRGIISTSKENEIIVDLFLGSGSTLIACEQTNRICYGMELDPKYVDVIRKRYAKFVGKEDVWQTETPAL